MSEDLTQAIHQGAAEDDDCGASPVVSPIASPDFNIVTGDTPISRTARCTARHKAAALIGIAVAAVALLILVLQQDAATKTGAALVMSPSTASMSVAIQNRQHASKTDSVPSEKTVDVSSFSPRSSTFVCMYECTGGEPADYNPANVHTVGGCQATPCSAFGQEYCGVWGGQASEAFELPSQELCTRYVETMKPMPVHQRAAAFHVTVTALLNKVADASATIDTRRVLARADAQLSFEKLRAALPKSVATPLSPTELGTCEEILDWAKDRVRESAEHDADFVCDADTICPHFDGDHASQCQKFEQGLHVHFEPTGGASLCSWVKDKMDGDDPDVEAIPQVMCTQLLTQVDGWLGEGAVVVHEVLSNGVDAASLTAGAVRVADEAEKLACHQLLPHCAKCCEVIVEVLDKTVNPWLVDEGRHLVESIEHVAARFWHWLCNKIHQL